MQTAKQGQQVGAPATTVNDAATAQLGAGDRKKTTARKKRGYGYRRSKGRKDDTDLAVDARPPQVRAGPPQRQAGLGCGGQHVAVLPDELLLNVLEQLPVRELLRSRRVCRRWRGLVEPAAVGRARALELRHAKYAAARLEPGRCDPFGPAGDATPGLAHRPPVWTLAVSPDGCRVYSASHSGTIFVQSLADGAELPSLVGHTGFVNAMVFGRGGGDGRLFTCSKDGTIKVWAAGRTGPGVLLQTLTEHTNIVYGIGFSPDAETFFSVSYDKTVRLWSAGAAGTAVALLATAKKAHTTPITALAVHPLDGRAATGSLGKDIKLWRRGCDSDGAGSVDELAKITGHRGGITSLAFTPDGAQLYSGAKGDIMVHSTADGFSHLRTVRRAHGTTNVLALLFTPYGRLYSSGGDKTIRVWTKDGERRHAWRGHHTGYIRTMALLEDGRLLSGSADSSIRIW